MTSKVLNAWPEVGLSSVGNPVSRICFESSIPSGYNRKPRQTAEGDYEITVVMEKANSPAPDHILVADGLVRKFEVQEGQTQSTSITLERPVVGKDEIGCSPSDSVRISKRTTQAGFKGRIIGIDPPRRQRPWGEGP